jgi:4-aminobutyrate aminotransferase-like enzyme
LVGKPFGNGYPLSAVVCTEEVARSFDNGMEFFNTCAGSQLASAIGLEVINIIEDENLM